MLSLLPGPVRIAPEVKQAFLAFFECHRSEAFKEVYHEVRKRLCTISRADAVQLMMGTGTLANDAIALQLRQIPGCGLVLCNGEFGERLVDHAERAGLTYDVLQAAWGERIEMNSVREQLRSRDAYSWIWAVHCETSTGMLNDVDGLEELCNEREIRLCLDCISSIGLLPLDLQNVYLASGTSSKGLASFAGLAMVFHNHALSHSSIPTPRYLDLHSYSSLIGAPFTMSPNLLYALREALQLLKVSRKEKLIRDLSNWLRDELEDIGLRILVSRDIWNPAVITVDVSGWADSRAIGNRLRQVGVLVNFESSYLLKRNWLQLCLMTEMQRDELQVVIDEFRTTIRTTSSM